MEYLLLIPIGMLALFVGAFIVAWAMDYIQYQRDRKDLFKVLSKDYNERKRPAAK